MNSIKNWIKERLDIIDNTGVDRMNYLLMKVDYLSTELKEAKEKIECLDEEMKSIYDRHESLSRDVSIIEETTDNLESDIQNHNLGFMWEVIDENKENLSEIEVPTEHDIREIVKMELDELKADSEPIPDDGVSNERLITGIVRSEISQYNKFIVDALNNKSFD